MIFQMMVDVIYVYAWISKYGWFENFFMVLLSFLKRVHCYGKTTTQ